MAARPRDPQLDQIAEVLEFLLDRQSAWPLESDDADITNHGMDLARRMGGHRALPRGLRNERGRVRGRMDNRRQGRPAPRDPRDIPPGPN